MQGAEQLDVPPPTLNSAFSNAPGRFTCPASQTVGHLLRQLNDLDPELPIRLAVNPDFPFAHYLGARIVVLDGTAFIADDGQENYLATAVSNVLGWD
ncbi:hypothetical protein [Streptomyces buecherae]|uniref:hypothetical protein n=1 Tax=Streptomyces buecherae TaxID=2763006 RepID=UPI0037B933A9